MVSAGLPLDQDAAVVLIELDVGRRERLVGVARWILTSGVVLTQHCIVNLDGDDDDAYREEARDDCQRGDGFHESVKFRGNIAADDV